MTSDFNRALPDPPAAMVACRIGGEQMHISAISENALWLRCDQPSGPRGALEVRFRQMNGTWRDVSIHNYTVGTVQSEICGAPVRLSFDSGDFKTEFRTMTGAFAAYLRAFSAGETAALVDYPHHLDDVFSEIPPSCDLKLPGDREICIALHEPALWQLYLQNDCKSFAQSYARLKRQSRAPEFSRIYVGNAFCNQLFPDLNTLQMLTEKAAGEGIALTLVTAPDPRLPDAALHFFQGEIVVNDWGLLGRLQSCPNIRPVLGILLNKRRKDPRIPYKPDLEPELLRENSLDSPVFRAFLRNLGVERWEFERCGYDFAPPDGHCSLHLPYYQTNTSVYCPLRALCEHGDRGYQCDAGPCPGYCAQNRLVYPSHLKLTGRWNSIFALDDRPVDPAPGFDRIVLNL